MRHLLQAALAVVLAVALGACDAAGPADTAAPAFADGQAKVPVCHYSSDGTYKLLSVGAGGAAAHGRQHDRDHAGADYEGAPVPGADGLVFDAACQPVSAYTTVDFGGASETVGDFYLNSATVIE